MIRKIDLANEALNICGLVSSSNQATPEMTNTALKAIERAMARISESSDNGYILSDNLLNPDANADSGIYPSLVDAVIKFVSVDVCEALAAPFTGEIKQQSIRAYRELLNLPPPTKAQRENMPSGAGNQRGCFGYPDNYFTAPDIEEATDET